MGMVSANYVKMLENRLAPENFHFFNLGVNNDLVYNLYRRLWFVVAHKPDVVIVLAGTNDVIGSLSAHSGMYMIFRKFLPRWPTLDWSLGIMRKLIRKLKAETRAQIAIVSIPILGENLDSIPMARARSYNLNLAEIAREEGADFLSVFDRQETYLRQSGHAKGRTYITSVTLTLELALRRLLFHESLDTFSKRRGFQLLCDSVHMNSMGASLIADEIEVYLRKRI